MHTQSPEKQEREPSHPSASARGHFTSTKLETRPTAALSARVKTTVVCVAAAIARRAAGNRQKIEKEGKRLAKKQGKNKAKVKAENEVQGLKQRQDIVEKQRMEQKARKKQEEREAKEERKRHNEQKRQKKAEDKRRKRPWKGVAWGFDDRAGVRSVESSETLEGCYASDGNLPHGQQTDADHSVEVDEIERPGRRRHKGNTWGVEAGGPGPEVVFEFGVPIDPKSPKYSTSWRRRARKKVARGKREDDFRDER